MIKKRVLLVDDEKDFVEVLRTRLESNNYEVITAYDGEEALERAEREEPDIIILDIVRLKFPSIITMGFLKNNSVIFIKLSGVRARRICGESNFMAVTTISFLKKGMIRKRQLISLTASIPVLSSDMTRFFITRPLKISIFAESIVMCFSVECSSPAMRALFIFLGSSTSFK